MTLDEQLAAALPQEEGSLEEQLSGALAQTEARRAAAPPLARGPGHSCTS